MDVREKLLQAALRVFQEAGSRGATTRRIAAEAGVNEITLFRHFGSKAALLSEALQTAARDDLGSRLPDEPADPGRELAEWCRTHMGRLRRSRSIIRTCMGELEQAPEMARCAAAAPQRVADELGAYLERLRERGMAAPDLDVPAAVSVLMGTVFGDVMGRDLAPERYAYPAEEAPERYVRLFLRAIGAADPPVRRPRLHGGAAAQP